jgi:hypothetical protein
MKTIEAGLSGRVSALTSDQVQRLGKIRNRPTPPITPANVALPTQRIVCREITPADLEQTIDLLTVGFQKHRSRSYWENAIKRLSDHPTPAGYPKFGYLLECDRTPVGVLLLIFSARVSDGATAIRCNGSSLFVQPLFRGYAAVLIKRALRFKEVTYLNITPGRPTWAMLTAQGYKRFSNGVFVAFPALCGSPTVKIQLAAVANCGHELKPFETELLLSHAKYGCLSLICEHDGKQYPFVFGLGRNRLAYLTYCRDHQEFVQFAGAIGRFLLLRGYPAVVLDANGSIAGLIGKYFAVRPKYAMGPEIMRLGDLPYTERVMFGF